MALCVMTTIKDSVLEVKLTSGSSASERVSDGILRLGEEVGEGSSFEE